MLCETEQTSAAFLMTGYAVCNLRKRRFVMRRVATAPRKISVCYLESEKSGKRFFPLPFLGLFPVQDFLVVFPVKSNKNKSNASPAGN
jgi:hypothetical protein